MAGSLMPFCVLFSFSIYPSSFLCIILLSSDVSTRALLHCYSRTFKFTEVWQEIWHFLSLARFSFYSLCVASRLLLLSLLLLLLPFIISNGSSSGFFAKGSGNPKIHKILAHTTSRTLNKTHLPR